MGPLGGNQVVRVEPSWWGLCPYKEKHQRIWILSLSITWALSKKISFLHTRKGILPKSLISHLPASRSEQSKCLMFKPRPSLWQSLQQPELTKTMSTNENALNPKDTNSREGKGVPLVVQWIRIRLPVQRIRIQSLAWEDLTWHGATKPVCRNYWACAVEPGNRNYGNREPVLSNERSHHEKPVRRKYRVAPGHRN